MVLEPRGSKKDDSSLYAKHALRGFGCPSESRRRRKCRRCLQQTPQQRAASVKMNDGGNDEEAAVRGRDICPMLTATTRHPMPAWFMAEGGGVGIFISSQFWAPLTEIDGVRQTNRSI